jgi:hypothetical protein
MLSRTVIVKINRQIEDELRIVDSICSSQQDKLDAIERIAKLKALLSPQPSREEILDELASAITVQVRQKDTQNVARLSVGEVLADMIFKHVAQ